MLLQAKSAAAQPQLRAAAAELEQRLSTVPHVEEVGSPFDAGASGQVSEDGRSALLSFEIAGEDDAAIERVDAALAATAAVQKAHPELRVEQAGSASADKAFEETEGEDFKKAETLSIPLTLLILLFAFGALVAAGLPLLLGLTAVGATFGLLGPISQLAPLHGDIGSVVLLIGLAIGVDYSMFYLRREMEERDKGKGPRAALEAAAATSGHAVVVSGSIVLISMAGMLLGEKGWTEKGRVPLLAKRRHRSGGRSRAWSWFLDRVLARPRVSAGAATAVLVALALPALGMHTTTPGIGGLPADEPVRQTYERMQTAFPGATEPAEVVVQAADVTSPQVREGIADVRRAARATGRMSEPVDVSVNPDRTPAVVTVPMQGSGDDAAARASLQRLRADVVPATIEQVPGTNGQRLRRHGRQQGRQRHDDVTPADRVRVRLRSGVPAVAPDVPLARDPDQGDRAQPAVGRRELRRADARLPARLGRVPAGLPVRRRRRRLAAAVPVRRAVRPVDGRPRVHPQPDPRGGARRRVHRRRGERRDQGHGRRGHERGGGDDRGVLDLRHARRHGHEAARRRARGRDLHRRDDRPGGAAARDDEALGDWNWFLPRRLAWLPRIGSGVAAQHA